MIENKNRMTKTFFISDQHYGHENILTFTGIDGKLIRPEFKDVEEMNSYMIDAHNSVVGTDDDVYFGGDVCFSNQVLDWVMPRLNGNKRLILGNHDKLKPQNYLKYFRWIRVNKNFNVDNMQLLMTHYPVHPFSNYPHTKVNIHGHIHEKDIEDWKWFNISAERLNYTPIEMDDMLQEIMNRKISN